MHPTEFSLEIIKLSVHSCVSLTWQILFRERRLCSVSLYYVQCACMGVIYYMFIFSLCEPTRFRFQFDGFK